MRGGKNYPLPIEKKVKKTSKEPTNWKSPTKKLEDDKYAIAASLRFAECDESETRARLQPWIDDNEWSTLMNSVPDDEFSASRTRISVLLSAMERVVEAMKNLKTDEWNHTFPALLCLAKIVMGWTGRNARNPRMAKMFFELITEACANSFCRREQSGLYTVYLQWALERLSEPKFSYLARRCLMTTCYQFEPRVVMTSIIRLLQETDDKQNFTRGKRLAAIILFVGNAVDDFGVDNFYFRRIINLILEKLQVTTDPYVRSACYSALCALYEQLGSQWKDILIPSASKYIQKTLNAKLNALHNGKGWKQQRWTKQYTDILITGYYRETCGSALVVDDILQYIMNCHGAVHHPNDIFFKWR